jgi:hypothetical protein
MQFRAMSEIVIVRKVVKHLWGPCLLCNQEAEYSRLVARRGEDFVRKHLAESCRPYRVKQLCTGLGGKKAGIEILEGLICEECRTKLPELRRGAAVEREDELRRRKEATRRYYADLERTHYQDRSGSWAPRKSHSGSSSSPVRST